VGDVLGRGIVVGGLSRNVFLVGGLVSSSNHCFRLAWGLVGARDSEVAWGEGGAAGDFGGGWADTIAGAIGFRGEEARGFVFSRTAAEYRASCLASTESALSTPAFTSASTSAWSFEASLASADDVDTVSRYARGDAFSLPFREARGGWMVVTARSLLVVGAFASSGTVITRSMTFGSEVAGVGETIPTLVVTGG
jgi:hypothetical protein